MSIYHGVTGLRAAYFRFQDWLNIDLPREWQRLDDLLTLLGGQTAAPPVTPPPTVPPPAAPPSEPGTLPTSYPTVDGYSLSDLSAADAAAVVSLITNITVALQTQQWLELPYDGPNQFVGTITTYALVLGHFQGNLGALGVLVTLPGPVDYLPGGAALYRLYVPPSRQGGTA